MQDFEIWYFLFQIKSYYERKNSNDRKNIESSCVLYVEKKKNENKNYVCNKLKQLGIISKRFEMTQMGRVPAFSTQSKRLKIPFSKRVIEGRTVGRREGGKTPNMTSRTYRKV